jgi:hypothetical protein
MLKFLTADDFKNSSPATDSRFVTADFFSDEAIQQRRMQPVYRAQENYDTALPSAARRAARRYDQAKEDAVNAVKQQVASQLRQQSDAQIAAQIGITPSTSVFNNPAYNKYQNQLEANKNATGSFADSSALDVAGTNAAAGIVQFGASVSGLLDAAFGWIDFNGDKSNFVSRWAQNMRSGAQQWGEEAQEVNKNAGKVAGAIGQYVVQPVYNALPQAMLALATGGSSVAATLPEATGTGLMSTVANGLKTVISNPMFWTSTAQEMGGAFNDAISAGADRKTAATTGLITGLINGTIEIEGGIETLPKAVRNLRGWKAVMKWVKSTLDEGKEEILQDTIGELVSKVTYDKNKPFYSTTGNAVINPKQILQEGISAMSGAAILGGVQTALVNLGNPSTAKAETVKATAQQLNTVNEQLPENLRLPEINPETASAKEVVKFADDIKTITDKSQTVAQPQMPAQPATIAAEDKTAQNGIHTQPEQPPVVAPVNEQKTVQPQTTAQSETVQPTQTATQTAVAEKPATENPAKTGSENKIAPASESWRTTRIGTEEEAQSLTQIVKQAYTDLDIPIVRGNIVGRSNVAGQYNIFPETVHIRTNNDILTIAHEIGHHLDNLYDLQGKASDAAKAELVDNLSPQMAAAYKENKLTGEGIAEFVRSYLSNPEIAKTTYPEFSKVFEKYVPADKMSVVNRLAKSMNTYLSASLAEQYRKSISMPNDNKTSFSEKVQSIKDNFAEKMIDDLHGLKKFGDAAKNNFAYVLAQNSRYAGGTVDAVLKTELRDMNGKYVGESLLKAVEDVNVKDAEELRDFNAYLMLRHAPERIDLGQTIFANPELANPQNIAAEISRLEAQYPKFKDASERVYKFQKNLLQAYGVDSGLISQEIADEWNKKYPHYVPFQRDLTNTQKNASQNITQKGVNTSPSPFKTARGSGLDIIAPLESIVKNANSMILAAKRNAVMQATTQIAATTEGLGKFLEKISTPIEAKKFDATQLKESTIKALQDKTLVDGDTLDDIINGVISDTLVQYGRSTKLSKNTMLVLNNGELEYWLVNDPMLLHSLENVSPQTAKGFWDAYGKVTRVITQAATGGNVFWSVFSNAIRDIQTGAIYDRSGNIGKWLLNIGKAYYQQVTDKYARAKGITPTKYSEYYREYLALGGANNISRISADRNDTAKSFRGILSAKKNLNPFTAIANISDVIEQAPRMAEYAALRDKGYTSQEAFYQAMEVTTNFRRGGTWSRQINKAVPFFNANIQGIDKAVRNFTAEDVSPAMRKKVATRRLARFAAASLILAFAQVLPKLFNDDEKKAYKQLSTYQKNNAFNIYLGDGKFFSIKKPRELGILTSFFERSMEYALLTNEKAYYDFGEYSSEQLLPPLIDVLPLLVEGDTDAVGGSLASSLGAVGSAFSLALNVDYRGNPIVSQALSGLQPRFQYDSSTSWLAKTIGDITNLSPKKIDYALNTWLGMYQTVNKSLLPVDGSERDWSLGIANTYVKDNQYTTDIVNRFYTGRDEALKNSASYPDKTKYKILAKDYSSMAQFYSNTTKIAQNTDMTTETNRAARQTVLEMLEQFSDDTAAGKSSAIKSELNTLAAETSDTSFFPQTMDSVFNYTLKSGSKVSLALTYTQYLAYQTRYNAYYYNEIGKVINKSYTTTKLKLSAVEKAKRTAKEQVDDEMYKMLTGK